MVTPVVTAEPLQTQGVTTATTVTTENGKDYMKTVYRAWRRDAVRNEKAES